MSDPKPSVGRMVHYVSYGTPNGEYQSACRAAVITIVNPTEGVITVGLHIMNPTGLFFDERVVHDEHGHAPGTWHWPERV